MLPTNVSIAFAVPAHSLLVGEVVVSCITSGPSDSGPTITVFGNVSAQIPFSYLKYRSTVVLFCNALTNTPSFNLEPLTPNSTCVLLIMFLTKVPSGIVVYTAVGLSPSKPGALSPSRYDPAVYSTTLIPINIPRVSLTSMIAEPELVEQLYARTSKFLMAAVAICPT